MEQIQKRKLRIEILLALVVISGLFWFMKFGSPESSDSPVKQEEVVAVVQPRPAIIEGPKPSSFESFSVPGFEEVYRMVRCEDILYTVLIFSTDVDYRKDPRAAVYNSANPCTKGEQVEIFIREPLPAVQPGKYYMVVADQGASGGWYNPR
jgi:hypothetical protein